MMLLKATVEFVWLMGWGVQRHFVIKPNYHGCVVVELGLGQQVGEARKEVFI